MRLVGRVLSLLLLAVSVVLFLGVTTAPATLSGYGYALGLLALAAAWVMPIGGRRGALVGALLLFGTLVLRLVTASSGAHLRMATPDSASSRWIDRLVDEEDLSVNAARALYMTGFIHDPDVPRLAEVMRRAYTRMRVAEGATPSPVVATYLGEEAPGHDDTIEVGDVATSAGVVVFLHGFAGSFTLPCWVVAQAAADAGYATVCPSTRWVGDWWSSTGQATLRETLTHLQARGAHHFVLAGLSNGGIGASLLASRMRGAFSGLIVISGASPSAVDPMVPVLAIQGEDDAQIPAEVVAAYASRVGARYVSLPAGHFALLMEEERAHEAIAQFLRERRRAPPASLPEAPPHDAAAAR